MKLDSLRKLYVHELKDLYSAEMLLLARFRRCVRQLAATT